MHKNFDLLLTEYQKTLADCRQLYLESGQFCATDHPDVVPDSPKNFIRLMDDLHRGLLVKVFFSVAEADRTYDRCEKVFAKELVLHAWGRMLDENDLKPTMIKLSNQAESLKWYGLVRPFTEIEPLRDRVGRLETIVIRMANLVAKADGKLTQEEANMLHTIQEQLDTHLRAIPADLDHDHAQATGSKAVRELSAGSQELRKKCELDPSKAPPPLPDSATEAPKLTVDDARAELDKLIGLGGIKDEIESLINYLVLQRNRAQAGLPGTQLSLHTVFTGNPGTGKTTVARIVGQILGAMEILKKGHVIETDRSGLVAEFAGQTGPKTNKKIDEAIDGILFIDEAYTLISEGNDDPYGHEAVQTLLKRMEDDRDRLVVVLAGYPEPIERLLDANPGLRSRFSRRIDFEDYGPKDLGRILELMCKSNQYVLNAETRGKFLLGATYLVEHRDEHFGNGRLVRNLFEDAIRHLANRIADQIPMTKELLTHLKPEDIQFTNVPGDVTASLDRKFRVLCPGCSKSSIVPTQFLSRRVDCPCGERFRIDWAEVFE